MASSTEGHVPRKSSTSPLPAVLPLSSVEDMGDDWNPMNEDYMDPEFNHYTHGPAKFAPKSKVQAAWPSKLGPGMEEYAEPFKVFINRLPFALSEQGVAQICTKVSAKPVSVFKKPRESYPKDATYSWAIAEFATHGEAEKVIRALHRTPPMNLDVKFGYSDRDRQKMGRDREEARQWEVEKEIQDKIRRPVENLMNCIKPPLSQYGQETCDYATGMGRARGLLGAGRGLSLPQRCHITSWPRDSRPGTMGVHNLTTVNLNANLDPFNLDQETDYFGHYAGGYNDDSTAVISKALDQMNLTKPVDTSSGRRQVFGGRGFLLPSSKRKPGVRAGNNLEQLNYEGMGRPQPTSAQSDYGTQESSTPDEEDRYSDEGAALVHAPPYCGPNGSYGRCCKCSNMTTLRCSNCATWLCSEVCRALRPMHPLSCKPMPPGTINERWQNNYVTNHQEREKRPGWQRPAGFNNTGYHSNRGNRQGNNNSHANRNNQQQQLNYNGGENQNQKNTEVSRDQQKKPELPPPAVSVINKDSKYVNIKIQNIIKVHGEPEAFVCIVTNDETLKYEQELEKLQQECEKVQGKTDTMSFEQGLLAAALPSGLEGWCRCVLDCEASHGMWHILCCDTGRALQLTPTWIQPLPEQFKDIPRLAMTCSIVETLAPPDMIWGEKGIQIGVTLNVAFTMAINFYGQEEMMGTLVSSNGDDLCLVRLSDWLPLRPALPVLPSVRLSLKCEVVMTTFCSPNMVYVRPLDNESEETFNCVLQEVTMQCVLGTPLTDLPEIGTVVGVCSHIDGHFYRGLVTRYLSPETVLVVFVDFGNKEECRASQMFPLSEELAKVPGQAVLVKLKDVADTPTNIPTFQYLSHLVVREVQLQLNFEEPGDPVTLMDSCSGASVNHKLDVCVGGSWVPRDGNEEKDQLLIENYSEGREKLDSLMATYLPVGKRARLACIQWLGGHTLTCCVASEPLLRYIVGTLPCMMWHYVNNVNTVPVYVPYPNELVLAQFEEDGLWYRALVSANKLSTAEVTYIDYGNFDVVPHKKICKMPPDFSEAPPLATFSSLAGLEQSDFPNFKLSKRIAELLCTHSTFEGIVLSQDKEDLTAEIYVPKIIKVLTDEKLIPESRLEKMEKKINKMESEVKKPVTEILHYYLQEKKEEKAKITTKQLAYCCESSTSEMELMRKSEEAISNNFTLLDTEINDTTLPLMPALKPDVKIEKLVQISDGSSVNSPASNISWSAESDVPLPQFLKEISELEGKSDDISPETDGDNVINLNSGCSNVIKEFDEMIVMSNNEIIIPGITKLKSPSPEYFGPEMFISTVNQMKLHNPENKISELEMTKTVKEIESDILLSEAQKPGSSKTDKKGTEILTPTQKIGDATNKPIRKKRRIPSSSREILKYIPKSVYQPSPIIDQKPLESRETEKIGAEAMKAISKKEPLKFQEIVTETIKQNVDQKAPESQEIIAETIKPTVDLKPLDSQKIVAETIKPTVDLKALESKEIFAETTKPVVDPHESQEIEKIFAESMKVIGDLPKSPDTKKPEEKATETTKPEEQTEAAGGEEEDAEEDIIEELFSLKEQIDARFARLAQLRKKKK